MIRQQLPGVPAARHSLPMHVHVLGANAQQKLTWHLLYLLAGQPLPTPRSYLGDSTGNPFQFELYPEVNSVSPATGSLAGGTIVTIRGRGFPTFELDPSDTLAVTVGGSPCTVTHTSYSEVRCTTGAQPAQPPTAFEGVYPGMRGVEYEHYETDANRKFEDLWTMNTTGGINLSNSQAGSFARVLVDKWESPMAYYASDYWCSRSRAFFTAPRAGAYKFIMVADDFATLNATYYDVSAWAAYLGLHAMGLLMQLGDG